ncbi:ATP-dependent helicase [Peptostreptococcus canis]|uniref:DNA 3'-5' helicase n=1 Tax=Peptostreptococcus canis TaxID=1159213 RepID=A0ABR6TIS7_9FIRM|nr:UvrD-helicase domain-containing protein [Peptostreptococcus canis]MBC2575327.1 UvrD-helicase domain-containing protein [Peptostreptococcus canis]MBP1997490.1 DNA helicase-2/ATP-dependent DNA helicase PcrA [Peptostreptococcus canis]
MYIDDLNPAQKQAVEKTEGPVLILAGAGSGKTKVLTTRIAYLVEDKNVNPGNILAITFTNKAANEMRERVENMVGESSHDMWISTFHSCCVKILRKDINKIGYNRSFVIYDASDQITLVKECIKELDLNDKKFEPKSIISTISSAKDKLMDPKEFARQAGTDFWLKTVAEVYAIYQERLIRSSALDFDDLIFKTVELLKTNEDVLNFYRGKFRYIMVDEYQDTSRAQYELVKMLAMGHQNICVVGDDDQSIYGWRGADIRNILEFEKDYDNVFVVKLEQNYRSTQIILDTANYLIANNTERKKKKLWSDKKDGKPVKVKLLKNEVEEANYVVNEIYENSMETGRNFSEYAVLYRANAQARAVEDALNRFQIPYNIYGGTKFYERKEIKDLIAYLRVIVNPQDDISVKRIINVPRRGIGLKTIEKLEDRASMMKESLYSVLLDVDNNSDISTKSKKGINEFVDLIGIFRSISDGYPPSIMVDKILEMTGYLAELEAQKLKNEKLQNGKSEEAQDRIDNLQEFKSIAIEYEKRDDGSEEVKNLSDFLANISLSSDMDDENSKEMEKVSLMTMHSSKGLEFPVVFIVGMEEKVFPIARAISSLNDSDIEEERRLCYVGITRAMRELYLTHTASRTLYGKTNVNLKSRFLKELPDDSIEILDSTIKPVEYAGKDYSLLQNYAQKYKNSMSVNKAKEIGARILDNKNEIQIDQDVDIKRSEGKGADSYNVESIPKVKKGTIINHPSFGEGAVISKLGGEITVAFNKKGVKKINLEYTTIKVLKY